MKRTLMMLAAAATSLLMAACETNPTVKAESQVPPVATAAQMPKTLVEMEFELEKALLEHETVQTMALIKFASDSDSDFAKGMVAGIVGGAKAPGAGRRQGGGFLQAAMAQKQHESAVALKREEIAAQNSLWNRGLQVFDRVIGYRQYRADVDLKRFGMQLNADQERYRLDNLYRVQQGSYDFAGKVVDKGPYFFSLPMGSQPVQAIPAE